MRPSAPATRRIVAYVSFHGTGVVGCTTTGQYAVDATTGVLSPLSPPTAMTGTYPGGSAVNPSTAFAFVTNIGDNTVLQYSIATNGALTALAPATVAAGSQPDFIAIDPTNKYAYVANFTPNLSGIGGPGPASISQYLLQKSGQLMLMPMTPATVAAGPGCGWLSFDPFGVYLYCANIGDTTTPGSISEYSIGANGALTLIRNVSGGRSTSAIATTYVGG